MIYSENLLTRGDPYCYLKRKSITEAITLSKGDAFQIQTHTYMKNNGNSSYSERSSLEGKAEDKIDHFACYNGIQSYPENMAVSLRLARSLVKGHLQLKSPMGI